MIDELAKAIWNTREARFPAYIRRKPDQLNEARGAFQNCREEALAVLRRLREPTPEMIDAFHEAIRKWHREEGEDADVFRAMIDAAIVERK
jgi:hypothetical protein